MLVGIKELGIVVCSDFKRTFRRKCFCYVTICGRAVRDYAGTVHGSRNFAERAAIICSL